MILSTHLSIEPPKPFDFKGSVYSHGWATLAPNLPDREGGSLRRVERLNSGKVVLLEMRGGGSLDQPGIDIQASHAGELTRQEQDEIRQAVGRMFRIEEDLSEFYALCRQRGGRWERPAQGLGRLMRSPMIFEDVVKTICTTNIQWGGTRRMVSGLVKALGEPYPGDPELQAFPTPLAIAALPPEAFGEMVRMGYRTGYVHELGVRVTSGELDLEALRDDALPTPELKKRLLAIKGVGQYAAATLLMLLGRYDELTVDTAFRQFVSKKYFPGQRPSDEEARAIYEDWGRWKYLAYWFDIWESFQ